MSCDISNLTFSVAGSASLYSQMAGVLAGFAFGAIALVLPGEHRGAHMTEQSVDDGDARSDGQVLLALIAAFMSLVIATIEYAVLAGEQGCSLLAGRAASEEFLAGIAFAFAVLLLLYAVVQLVTHSRVGNVSHHVRLIVTILGPALAIMFVWTGGEDVAASPWQATSAGQRPAPQMTAFYDRVAAFSLVVPAGVFVVCLLAWFLGRRYRRQKPIGGTTITGLSFPYLSLGLSVIASVRLTSLTETNPADHVSAWEVWTGLVVCTVVLLLQAFLLAFERGADVRQTAETDSATPDPAVQGLEPGGPA